MYTEKQKEVISYLEKLVGQRFTLKTLSKEVSKYFGEKIKVDYTEEQNSPDFNLIFASETESTYGYFDIYVLKTREKGIFYITEVAYEFD